MSNITQGVKYSLITRQLSSHVKLTHRSRAAVLDDILWHVPKNAAVVYCLENFCNNCNTKAIIKKKKQKKKTQHRYLSNRQHMYKKFFERKTYISISSNKNDWLRHPLPYWC